MSTIFDNDILIHHIAAPGLPGDGFTAAEATNIRDDLDTMLARPVITGLADVPDVEGTPANGQALMYDADDDVWQPGDAGAPLTAISWGGDTVQSNIRILNFIQGLEINGGTIAGLPGLVIRVLFAGTGSDNSAARSDHTHAVPPNRRALFTASGTISGGTRTLTSGTVTGLNPAISYRADAILIGDVRGEGTGAGYSEPRVILNGVSNTRLGGNSDLRTVAGVDREYSMQHGGVLVSGMSSFAYSATISYRSGDPINISAGELVIRIRPNR